MIFYLWNFLKSTIKLGCDDGYFFDSPISDIQKIPGVILKIEILIPMTFSSRLFAGHTQKISLHASG